jgi:hypothetical protein
MKTEDIKKMAQAWKEVQEASYGKKKMEASDTQMGTITVKTDAERKARAQAYRDKKAETNEAMDPVNPKELKGKHKDRKDKDINNDGKVDSTDKYLHARRKAVSAAIKGKKKDQEVEVQTSEATDQLGEGIFGKTPKINIGKLHDLHAYHEKKAEAHAAAQKKHDSNSKMADHHSEQGYEHQNAADHLHNASKAYDKGDHKAVAKHLDMYHKTPVARQGIKEAANHGNMNNGSPAGEGLSPSAKKELARKTPMPDFVNEPKVDKKTFDAIRASGKKAPARNGDNTGGDKNVINKPMDITAKAPKKEDDGFKDS